MAEFAMSDHALKRALDMTLSGDEIREAVLRPRFTHWGEKQQSEQRTRGRVTACVRMSPSGVLTVVTLL